MYPTPTIFTPIKHSKNSFIYLINKLSRSVFMSIGPTMAFFYNRQIGLFHSFYLLGERGVNSLCLVIQAEVSIIAVSEIGCIINQLSESAGRCHTLPFLFSHPIMMISREAMI
jgi:hypothetical protein